MLSEALCTKELSSAPKAVMLALSWDFDEADAISRHGALPSKLQAASPQQNSTATMI
jgi:hypothetical protein